MVVVIKPASERVSKSALVNAWGTIAEHVAARKDVRDAVMLVLGYEQDIIDARPNRAIPADMAHAESCYADGKREGLDRAALALLDTDYIRKVRVKLDEMNKESDS